MKFAAFAAFSLVALATEILILTVRADDAPANLLTNGDFHKGMNGWAGDFRIMKPEDRTFSGSIDQSKGAPGVILDISGNACEYWFGLYQPFKAQGHAFDYAITYQMSDDFQQLDTVPNPDPGPAPNIKLPPLDITVRAPMYIERMLERVPSALTSPRPGNASTPPGPTDMPISKGPNFLLVLVNRLTGEMASIAIDPGLGSTGLQTCSGTLNLHDDGDKVAFVLFRQGTGKVALYNVTVTPSNRPDANAPLLDKSATLPNLQL